MFSIPALQCKIHYLRCSISLETSDIGLRERNGEKAEKGTETITKGRLHRGVTR